MSKVNPFVRHQANRLKTVLDIEDLDSVQDQLELWSDKISTCDLLDGAHLESIALTAGEPLKIKHKLQRKYEGWIVTRVFSANAGNVISLNMQAAWLNTVTSAAVWKDLIWDEQRVMGDSFDHTLSAAPVTINDPGVYTVQSNIRWKLVAIPGVDCYIKTRISLARNGAAVETMHDTSGHGHTVGYDGATAMSTAFTLSAGEVPAVLKVEGLTWPAGNSWWSYDDGGSLIVERVGNNPDFREITEGNNDTATYLQLESNADCTIDLWVF